MKLRILSGNGALQIMPFRKLGGKCHFFLRFCTRKRSETYKFFQANWRKSDICGAWTASFCQFTWKLSKFQQNEHTPESIHELSTKSVWIDVIGQFRRKQRQNCITLLDLTLINILNLQKQRTIDLEELLLRKSQMKEYREIPKYSCAWTTESKKKI